MNQNKFTFDEKEHKYFLDGKPMTGITSVLGIIGGDKAQNLIQWAADLAAIAGLEAEQIIGIKTEYDAIQKIEDWKEKKKAKEAFDEKYPIYKQARLSHRRKKEEAGQKGTDVHAEIEKLIKEAIEKFGGVIGEYHPENKQVDNFISWATKNEVKFLESEKRLYSEKLFVAGTCDFICEIEGKVWLGDIKTSSGIWPENFAQMAGYEIMITEMGLYKISGHIVINLKKNGEFEEKRSVSLEDYKKFFLACLDIYRVQEKIKGQII